MTFEDLDDPVRKKIKKMLSSNMANMQKREDDIFHHLCTIDPGGFDWEATQLRADLLGIMMVLTPDNLMAARLLCELGVMMDKDISDIDMIHQLHNADGTFGPLCLLILKWAPTLWPDESEEFHLKVARMLYDTVDYLFEEYETQVKLIGDPSAEVEDQIMYYLTNHLNLPLSSRCAILANIHYASKFDPGCMNITKTRLGLLGWTWDRKADLLQYCAKTLHINPYSVYGQLEFLKYDLETNHARLLEKLREIPETQLDCACIGHAFAMFYRKVSSEAVANRNSALASQFYWPIFSQTLDFSWTNNGTEMDHESCEVPE